MVQATTQEHSLDRLTQVFAACRQVGIIIRLKKLEISQLDTPIICLNPKKLEALPQRGPGIHGVCHTVQQLESQFFPLLPQDGSPYSEEPWKLVR